jgi:hypothetical protein
MRDREYKRLKIFGSKDNVSRHKPNLTKDNREENKGPEVLSEEYSADVAEGAFNFEPGIDQEDETIETEHRHTEQYQVTE